MTQTEKRWLQSRSRRQALAALAGVVSASPLFRSGVSAQLDPRPLKDHRRLPGLDEIRTAFDFEPVMFANLPLSVYDYTAHGDGSEFTLRRNRQAFDWVDLLPATPIDASRVDLSCDILGTRMKFPIMIAPTATQVPLHPDGEMGMHRAATESSNTPMIVSHNTSTSVDRIASAAKGPLWWQFYPSPNLEASRDILDTAITAGCTAVVVTVDQQASYYERSQQDRNLGGRGAGRGGRGGAPPTAATGASPAGPARYRLQPGRLWYTWQYLDEIRRMLKVPLLVKGILTAEDATLCIEHGVDGIIVSNHGGRSMDYGPSTLEVLPEIVAAVNHRIPVLTDSGYRRGSDILKALALGADAVLLGRATRWALGAFGAPGVQRLLEIFQRELVEAAAAAGRPNRASIDRSLVRTRFV
jgi:isopentenyl diphosphate isomerase/L-lactate dehydrogenase-like FMN-dependent dehydrogenase